MLGLLLSTVLVAASPVGDPGDYACGPYGCPPSRYAGCQKPFMYGGPFGWAPRGNRAQTFPMVRYTYPLATHYSRPCDYRTEMDYPWHARACFPTYRYVAPPDEEYFHVEPQPPGSAIFDSYSSAPKQPRAPAPQVVVQSGAAAGKSSRRSAPTAAQPLQRGAAAKNSAPAGATTPTSALRSVLDDAGDAARAP